MSTPSVKTILIQRILGWLILFGIVAGLVTLHGMEVGFQRAILVFLIAAGVFGASYLALTLIFKKP